MTAGAFLTFPPLVQAFGLHDIKNKAQAFRQAWPTLVPAKGKKDLSVYEAAYLVYVFAATKTLKDIKEGNKDLNIKIFTVGNAYNRIVQDSILTYLGGLIAGQGRHKEEITGRLSHIWISKKTGIMDVYFAGGKKLSFPDNIDPVNLLPFTEFTDDVTIIYPDLFKSIGAALRQNKI